MPRISSVTTPISITIILLFMMSIILSRQRMVVVVDSAFLGRSSPHLRQHRRRLISHSGGGGGGGGGMFNRRCYNRNTQPRTCSFLPFRIHPITTIPSATTNSISTDTSSALSQQKQQRQQLMQDILMRVRNVNYIPDHVRNSLIDFIVDDIHLGVVCPSMAQLLCSIDCITGQTIDPTAIGTRPAFCMVTRAPSNSNSNSTDDDKGNHPGRSRVRSANNINNHDRYLTLSTEFCGTTFASRTAAVGVVMESLRQQKYISGWRNELYPISSTFYSDPLFAMERAAVSCIGGIEYGVHINGLVRTADDNNNNITTPTTTTTATRSTNVDLQMWLARRSKTKSKYPGMLDHIAAGGQPIGISLLDNVIKECYEEAGIPSSLCIPSSTLHAVSAVSYARYAPQKDVVERCVLFCYDLYLPNDFVPQAIDGEVDAFYLVRIQEDIMNTMMSANCTDPIKPNCYIVIIDFLLRHGYLTPDTPGYLNVLRELRSGDCQ